MSMRFSFLALILIFAVNGAGAAQEIRLFELQHRIPAELIPALRPLLDRDVVMSPIGNKLVVKADRLKLAEIAETIDRLDQPLRRLMIEFREVALDTSDESGIGASGRIGLGDRAAVGLGKDRREGLRLGGYQARTRGSDDILQRVQTTEGRPAYLHTGQSIPISQISTYDDGQRVYRQHRTDYRDATIGFYVRPHVQGGRVILDVTRHAQRLRGDGRVFQLQDAGSRVQGELGEWIDFGGVDHQVRRNDRGIAYSVQTRSHNDRQYQIRVTELE